MSTKRFDTTISSGERGRVFIELPFDAHEAWGKKKRHFVRGTINGTEYEGSLGVRGGAYFMPVNAALQKKAGVGPGDAVSVVMEDASATASNLPDDLAQALSAEPEAKSFFDTLSSFYQNEYIEWVEGAKKPATRASRLTATVESLKHGKKQR